MTGIDRETSRMATGIFWFFVAATIAFLLRASFSRSWLLTWVAAFASFVVSIFAMYSIGSILFLATCLLLAAVVARRMHLGAAGWAVALLGAFTIWVAVVPAQYFGPAWLGGIGAYQIVGLVGLLLVLLPLPCMREECPIGFHHRPAH
jgi:hypothetical protein